MTANKIKLSTNQGEATGTAVAATDGAINTVGVEAKDAANKTAAIASKI